MSVGQKRKSSFLGLLKDEIQFFKSWIKKPLVLGAVSPSSRALALAMAAHTDRESASPVIELGPGTGVVTRALLEHGVAPERIVAIEYNPAFYELLKTRFPGCKILQGNAYDLNETLAAHDISQPSAVISSLPLLTQPLHRRSALITSALELMPEGAPFIQFSYGLSAPVKKEALKFNCSFTKSPWILFNLPPARVWCYSLLVAK